MTSWTQSHLWRLREFVHSEVEFEYSSEEPAILAEAVERLRRYDAAWRKLREHIDAARVQKPGEQALGEIADMMADLDPDTLEPCGHREGERVCSLPAWHIGVHRDAETFWAGKLPREWWER